MRRIPIRTKLAAALTVPLVAVGLVTLAEVVSLADDAREVRDQTSLATATIGPNGLITALQNERNWTSAHLVGVDQRLDMDVVGYDETRAATDAALAEFAQGLERRGDLARTAYAPALDGLAALDALRTEVDGHAQEDTRDFGNIALATEFFAQYTDLIDPFFGGMSRISIAMDDPELRQGALLMETVTRQLETTPQLTNALALPASVPTGPDDEAGINSPSEIADVAELYDSFSRQSETLRTASGPYAELADEYYPTEFHAVIDDLATAAISEGQIDVDQLLTGLDMPLDETYLGYRDRVAEALQDRADELNREATTRQQRFGLLMAVTLAAAVALTVLVSLSITRPLRSLTRQAKEMADRRLPHAVIEVLETPLGQDVTEPQVTPIRVRTRDEVADVAAALNTVQYSALDLAVEQAVLRRNIADSFVNLGRRNQNLLGRQLDFITQLESTEADPDTLASLFRLDHLATRMRRNAESLLVLAGIEPPRTWAAPLPLADVIRAALGEVEDYQRVTVRSIEPAMVVGSAATDVAHLLAELVENALTFSPPDQPVDIRGVAQSSRTHGGYTLVIIDAGMGMSPEELEAANRRLDGGESFTIAPSKYLGHYVAGNLAARHDISVRMHSSSGKGVTANVELPAALLAPMSAPPSAVHRPPTPVVPLATRPPANAPSLTASGLVQRSPLPARATADGTRPAVPVPSEAQLTSLARAVGQDRTEQHPTAPASPAPPAWPLPSAPPAAPGWTTAPPPPAAPARPPAAQPAGDPWHNNLRAGRSPADSTAPRPGTREDMSSPPPLARRDRGAQLPTTTPIRLQRSSAGEAPRGGAGAPGRQQAFGPESGAPPASGTPQGVTPPNSPSHDAATEVYGFLSSFSAGVQRGLEDTRSSRHDRHEG